MKKLLLAIVVLFVSCSVTDTEKDQVHSNAQMGFSVNYPEKWQMLETDESVTFFYNDNSLDSLEIPKVTVTKIEEALNVIQTRYSTRSGVETENLTIDSLFAFMAIEVDSTLIDAGHPKYKAKNVWVMISDNHLIRFVYKTSIDNFEVYLKDADRIINSAKFN